MLHTVCCILYASIWKPTLKLVGRKSSFDFVINPIFDFVSKVIILDDDWPFDNFESKTSVFIFFRSDRKDKPDVRTVISLNENLLSFQKTFDENFNFILTSQNDYHGKHIHLLLIHYHQWLTPKWFMQWTCKTECTLRNIFLRQIMVSASKFYSHHDKNVINYEIGQVNIAVLESLRSAFFCNASFLFSSISRCLSIQAIANILNSL